MISGHWWTPYSLLSTESVQPGENAANAIKNLRKEIDTWIAENNVIWNGAWSTFEQSAKQQITWPKDWTDQK